MEMEMNQRKILILKEKKEIKKKKNKIQIREMISWIKKFKKNKTNKINHNNNNEKERKIKLRKKKAIINKISTKLLLNRIKMVNLFMKRTTIVKLLKRIIRIKRNINRDEKIITEDNSIKLSLMIKIDRFISLIFKMV